MAHFDHFRRSCIVDCMQVLQDLEGSGFGFWVRVVKFGGVAVGKAHAVLVEQVFQAGL